MEGPLANTGDLEEVGEFLIESKYKHIPVRKSFGWPTSIQKPFNSIQKS